MKGTSITLGKFMLSAAVWAAFVLVAGFQGPASSPDTRWPVAVSVIWLGILFTLGASVTGSVFDNPESKRPFLVRFAAFVLGGLLVRLAFAIAALGFGDFARFTADPPLATAMLWGFGLYLGAGAASVLQQLLVGYVLPAVAITLVDWRDRVGLERRLAGTSGSAL